MVVSCLWTWVTFAAWVWQRRTNQRYRSHPLYQRSWHHQSLTIIDQLFSRRMWRRYWKHQFWLTWDHRWKHLLILCSLYTNQIWEWMIQSSPCCREPTPNLESNSCTVRILSMIYQVNLKWFSCCFWERSSWKYQWTRPPSHGLLTTWQFAVWFGDVGHRSSTGDGAVPIPGHLGHLRLSVQLWVMPLTEIV